MDKSKQKKMSQSDLYERQYDSKIETLNVLLLLMEHLLIKTFFKKMIETCLVLPQHDKLGREVFEQGTKQ